ncbi:glycosyltransferase family 4 protein [Ferrovibrio sp.]|uniref:MraY family glycosyltransferase n=1 Tax=Ferrovibrio sp. TaxID=1917215 RepID=UPI000CAE4069|nr:glycosyltransferase family 4 protein [Ferrovibrio sp.]PJI38677.1 MAG: glycosyl transferase [Ferrovibrio sp.]
MIGAAADWPILAVVAAGTGLFVFLLLKPLIGWLQRRAIMDVPNDRSSHIEVTPRGGGIATTTGILLGLAVWLALRPDAAMLLPMLGTAVLALVSWLDDRSGGLPVGIRLGIQAACVSLVLAMLPGEATITQGFVPVWLERIVLLFAWLWFTNLFNFMDGINGISGVEMIAVGLGAASVALLLHDATVMAAGLIVAAAAIGFLPWNWGARAKVFLGDVGSVPAGYLLGGLLLMLALSGNWAAALILPMFYWVDATYTLLRRLLRGEKIWQAHRSHFYQQGARKLGNHAAVAGRIAVLNFLLLVLAVVSLHGSTAALAAILIAFVATAALCRHFAEPA